MVSHKHLPGQFDLGYHTNKTESVQKCHFPIHNLKLSMLWKDI